MPIRLLASRRRILIASASLTLAAGSAGGVLATAPKPAAQVVKASPADTLKPPAVASTSAQEAATLAAAVEANRIARDGLAAQVDATRWQTRLGLGGLLFSALAGFAAVYAALYARKAWRENQRSADVAERMLIGYERPFLLLEVVKSGVTITGDSISFDVTTYRFRNLGRVLAT